MTELLTGIAPQPEFPQVDLSDDNADLLEFMMANDDILARSHRAVELVSWIFRVGHVTILHGAAKRHDAAERLAAVDRGIKTFESITALVGGVMSMSDTLQVNNQSARLIKTDGVELDNYFESSIDAFDQQMPRTAEVVRTSSSRFVGPLCSYALLGAAMSRKFELDCVT